MHYKPFQNEFYPTISLDEILQFLSSYHYAILDSKNRTNIYNWDKDWFEFKSEKDLDMFYIFLKLYYESAIDLEINALWNDNQRINQELSKKLKKYLQVDNRDIISKVLLKTKKQYDIRGIFEDWNEISKYIKTYDWFYLSLRINSSSFLHLLFRKITQYKWYDNLNKKLIINELYENISKKIDNDKNSSKRIEIFYDFDDYLENNRLVFPLLKELEENKNLVIDKIILKENYIHFYLEKFIDFKKDIILKISEKIIEKEVIKVEYKNETFYINNEEIPFDSKDTKIFHLYRFIFDAYNQYERNHLNYEQLEKYFEKNWQNYLKIKKDFFKNYDSKIRKDLQTKNKYIKEKFNIEEFIGIGKSWIWCQYYTPEKN